MYNLHFLGWKDFQNLCHTVLREVLGQTVERFLDSKDGGRDGGFAGSWKQSGAEDLSGKYVVQCKHTSKANSSLTVSVLADEFEKAKRLVKAGLCDSYVLMTNHNISGGVDKEIKSKLRAIGVKKSRNFGNQWLVQQITESSRLRMLVPRVYGLGDLSQILDHRAYEQAKALLESMHEEMSKVVVTAAYEKAVRAVEKHGFALLVGDPGSGKSTVASLLAMTAGDRWKSSVLKVVNAEGFKQHWNPHETTQFFWIDDSFGTTQYEPALAQSWNRHFPEAQAAIKRGAKVLMTSRNYIYQAARSDLKRSAFPLLEESQVVVDVRDLSPREKEQILYNHLKLGHQSTSFKSSVKPFLGEVASRPSFLPETVRRFADPMFTKGITLDRTAILRFFDHPQEWLSELISNLDVDARAAIGLIHSGHGQLANPLPDTEETSQFLRRFGSSHSEVSKSLVAMRESLVRLKTTDDGQQCWVFQHPSMEDAFSQVLGQSPDLLDIYLKTASINEIVTRVTCKIGDDKNAVVVPSSLYSVVVQRLSQKPSKPKGSRLVLEEQIEYFLARRTSDEFLREFCASNDWVLKELAQDDAPSHSSQLELAARLNKAGLLPEDIRSALSKLLIEAVVTCDEPEVLGQTAVKEILTSSECEDLHSGLLTEVVPNLSALWSDWRSRVSAEAEYIAGAFRDFLDSVEKELSGMPNVASAVEKQRTTVDTWLVEEEEEEKIAEAERYYANHDATSGSDRSTFDDIDQ